MTSGLNADLEQHNARIDAVATLLNEALNVVSVFYPPIQPAVPIIQFFIKHEVAVLKTGLMDGSIVPDGQGGFVPITNSRYDPRTGEFL